MCDGPHIDFYSFFFEWLDIKILEKKAENQPNSPSAGGKLTAGQVQEKAPSDREIVSGLSSFPDEKGKCGSQ